MSEVGVRIRERGELKEVEKEMLAFLLDMKFGCVDQIYGLVVKDKGLSIQSAQKYLQKLEAEGLVKSQRGLDGTLRKWYFASLKGWRRLCSNGFERHVAMANEKIWPTTFAHDNMLIQIREKLKSTNIDFEWHSERRIKSELTLLHSTFPSKHVPDAIVKTGGLEIGIEFEHTNKTPKRYEEKISTFHTLLGPGSGGATNYLFIVFNDYQEREISKIADIYGKSFKCIQLKSFFTLGDQSMKEYLSVW